MTLEVYSIKEAGSEKPHSIPRPIWEPFVEAFWFVTRAAKDAGKVIPKIDRYDYNVDHGLIILLVPSAAAIQQTKALVSQTVCKDPVTQVPWLFKAFLKHELPNLVQLSFQLDRKYKLPPSNTNAALHAMLAEIAVDNGWPSNDQISVVNFFWVPFRDPYTHKPNGKGYWLIRFRCPVSTAEFIRDEQKGLIQVLACSVMVHHMRHPCRGDLQFELVHANDPVDSPSPPTYPSNDPDNPAPGPSRR